MSRKMGKMWKDLGGYDQNIFSKKGFIKFMRVGKNILNRTATAQVPTPGINRWNYMKIKFSVQPRKQSVELAQST